MKLSVNALREYLSSLYDADVEIRGVWRLDDEKSEGSKDPKSFGLAYLLVGIKG